jgi:hypothetical protein
LEVSNDPQGNDISLGVQFHPSRELLAPRIFSFLVVFNIHLETSPKYYFEENMRFKSLTLNKPENKILIVAL